MLLASCRQPQASGLCSPESMCRPQNGSVPARKFRGAHPPLSFHLHLTQQQRLSPSRNDDFFATSQNFSCPTVKIDNCGRKDFQLSYPRCGNLRKCTWPWIKRADFSLDDFSWLGPIDFAVIAGQFRCVSAERVVLPNAR